MSEKILVKCDTCGKEFYKYSYKVGKHNFCNRECYLKFHSKNVKTYTCEICGKVFKGDKYNANRFCSRECYNEFHKIKNKERQCPICGKTFLAKASEDIYCCLDCYNKDRHPPKKEQHWNWKGGISLIEDKRDSSEYKKWRQAVYQRDNYKCCICGSKEKLNAHHIKPWKYYPDLRYDISNGITYCEKCHIAFHKKNGYDYHN